MYYVDAFVYYYYHYFAYTMHAERDRERLAHTLFCGYNFGLCPAWTMMSIYIYYIIQYYYIKSNHFYLTNSCRQNILFVIHLTYNNVSGILNQGPIKEKKLACNGKDEWIGFLCYHFIVIIIRNLYASNWTNINIILYDRLKSYAILSDDVAPTLSYLYKCRQICEFWFLLSLFENGKTLKMRLVFYQIKLNIN